ncbi:MAG: polysaccharide deacetylase family protein [Hyphomicrobiaceae bacterium]|nr:polysaccharide deacetylase family protein [Hyphomicrobiaceae bacterium]
MGRTSKADVWTFGMEDGVLSQRPLLMVGLTAFVLVGVGEAGAQSTRQPEAGRMCWPTSALAARGGENRIEKGRAQAYQPLPRGKVRMRPPLPWRSGGRVVRRVNLPPGQKFVAFTFDLCEQPYEISGYQGDIVDFLRREKVPATFFAGGKWIVSHRARAQQIMSDPLFEIGNHAWEHRNFQVLPVARMHPEIAGSQLAYQHAYDDLKRRACLARDRRVAYRNAKPRQMLFRFPFGACNRDAIEAVEKYGLLAIQWDVSSSDPWTGQSVAGMVKTVMRQVKPGSIVLFHANGRGWKTGAALPTLVRRLRADGYRFVTVSKLLTLGKPEYVDRCYDFRPGDVDRYKTLSRRLEAAYDRFYVKFGKTRPSAKSMPRTGPVPAARRESGGWKTKTNQAKPQDVTSPPPPRPKLLREAPIRPRE